MTGESRRSRAGIDDDFWREVPCGHPPAPLAAYSDGHWVCHCGWCLEPIVGMEVPGAPGPVVPCSKCGCYVAVPVEVNDA